MYNGDFSKWVNAAGTLIPIYDPATTKADSTSRTASCLNSSVYFALFAFSISLPLLILS